MKLRVTGKREQVEAFLERLDIITGSQCNNISKPYPQTRHNPHSKYVAVYIDFEDYELDEN